MSDRIFGAIPGVSVGAPFSSRRELYDAGVHRTLQAGIVGGRGDGAESIVLSGGYPDDADLGDVVIYTGHGGRNAAGRQEANQTFTAPGNGGLCVNEMEGLPVRVIRGAGGDPTQSPATGYRYDGLYRVASHWMDVGTEGFLMCRFELRRMDADTPLLTSGSPTDSPAAREESVVQRLVRSTAVARQVKHMYSHACQICGSVIETKAGPYAEGAHIKPLGRPHDGPDVVGNILCLCPNDHVRFDQGYFTLSSDVNVVRADTQVALGPLRLSAHHGLRLDCVDYHRSLHQGG